MVGFGLDNVDMGRKIAPLVVSLTDDIDHNLRVVVTQSFPREGDPDDYWEVSFAGYVLFMERDESYTVPDDYEVRHGRWLEVFERSRLMDHLSSYTFADDLFPGPLTHYCVCGEDQRRGRGDNRNAPGQAADCRRGRHPRLGAGR